jgi:hypothetical protein
MKFYLFLANLLFGITLLTFAVGASHFIGIILIRRLPHMPNAVKKQFRFLLLFAFISVSMFLFFGKVIGVGAHSLRFTDEAMISDQLIPRLVEEHDVADKTGQNALVSIDQSTTLFRARTPATETVATKHTGLSARYLTLVKTGYSSEECSRWAGFLSERGVKLERVSLVQSLFSGKVPAIVCLSDGFSEDQYKQLEQWAFDGGQIFFVGRPSSSHSQALAKILGIDSFHADENTEGVTFLFGGPYLNLGTQGGAKVTFGTDWTKAPGLGLAEINEGIAGSYVMNGTELSNLSPLVFSEYGKGRALWTSLPPEVYGKLSLIYGDLWKSLEKSLFAFLYDLPNAGVSARLSNGEPMKALAIHAEYKVDQILKLLPLLKDQNAKASAYFVYSEAQETPEVVEEWSRNGNEVGFSFYDHQTSQPNSFYETRDHLEALTLSAAKLVQKKQSPPGPYGLMLFPGVNATLNALGAALDLNFRYVIGDPFSEQMQPYQLGMGATKVLLPLYPDAAKITSYGARGNHLTILPTPLGDDFSWPMSRTDSELRSKLESIDAIYSWSGASTVYKIHSQHLKSGNLFEVLSSELKNKGKWMTVSELIHRNEILSQVKVEIDQKGLQAASVVIRNTGNESLINPTVNVIAGHHWSIDNGTQIDEKNFSSKVVTHWQINLSRLSSGETKVIPLRYR